MMPDDPFDQFSKFYGLRPGVQEQFNHNITTQVEIPRRQATLAMWMRFVALLSKWSFFIMLLIVALAMTHEPPLVPLAAIALGGWLLIVLLGTAAEVPFRLLLNRLEMEIEDPFRDSPMIEVMHELLAKTQPPPPEVVEKRVPVPYRMWTDRDEPKAEPRQSRLSDDFLDLIEFTKLAAIRGLTRSAWCGENAPRVKLPSGKTVSKSVWSEMIAELVDWGIVDRGGDGLATDWRMDPERAVAMLEDAASNPDPDALWQPEEEIP